MEDTNVELIIRVFDAGSAKGNESLHILFTHDVEDKGIPGNKL
jgi:hypothetical protein